MKRRPRISLLAVSCALSCFLALFAVTSCTKTETITQVVSIDSIKTTKALLLGRWFNTMTESRTYSGANLSNSRVDFYSGGGTYTEFKSDLTYNSSYLGSPSGNGVWDITSASQITADKGNATQERYYYIIALDTKILITQGPFKKDGTFYTPNAVLYLYYSK